MQANDVQQINQTADYASLPERTTSKPLSAAKVRDGRLLDLVETIMKEAGKPLSYKELAGLLAARGETRFAEAGKGDNRAYYLVYYDILNWPTTSPFVKAGKGKFGLRAAGLTGLPVGRAAIDLAKAAKPAAESKPATQPAAAPAADQPKGIDNLKALIESSKIAQAVKKTGKQTARQLAVAALPEVAAA